jgi:hypothetical protein
MARNRPRDESQPEEKTDWAQLHGEARVFVLQSDLFAREVLEKVRNACSDGTPQSIPQGMG